MGAPTSTKTPLSLRNMVCFQIITRKKVIFAGLDGGDLHGSPQRRRLQAWLIATDGSMKASMPFALDGTSFFDE
jgi:hypothetical protein